ncbi:hypothetical protein [Streptomyces sp. NPDC054787]
MPERSGRHQAMPPTWIRLREFIANARLGNPKLAAAFGTVLEITRALQAPEFALKVAGANDRLRTVVKELSTTESPLYVAETAAEFVAAHHTWDGTHPNPNGEIRIAAAFADTMSSGFGIGTPYPDITQVAAEAKETID